MRIQAITPFKLNNFTQKNNQNAKPNYVQNNVYNPIAYNDLTFKARLCRTPEEFYAEPCNKNYMPETMKQYLNADFDDRKNMPPEQMLSLVFDDINETKSLEQVRRIFPDEPLFKKLTDKPNKKPRVGVLAEINLMKEEDKTLFKNGKDNLGHYILKKIYLEGKTLDEINKDFKKDISVHYNGLSPITYQDTASLGIRFPNIHFWNSFVAHRRRFEPIKPRKPIERRNSSAKTAAADTKPVPKQKNRFAGVKDWEIDSFSDALIKGNGSRSETIKRLKKSSVRDEASLGFVAKYMGEINSVVLEKLHISPEMTEFFENYDGLSKSQKQRLDDYWRNTETRDLRSIIMKDVIKLFFEAYGVDGQNDDFKELLDYAHSIKPERLAQQQEHNRIQTEYDEMFAAIDAEESKPQQEELGVDEVALDELRAWLEDLGEDFGDKIYTFRSKNGDSIFINSAELKKEFSDSLKSCFSVLPKPILNRYVNFILSKDLPDSYMVSKVLMSMGYKIPDNDKCMPQNEVENLYNELNTEFYNSNKETCRALRQAVADAMKHNVLSISSNFVPILSMNPFNFLEFVQNVADFNADENLDKAVISSKYDKYKTSLTTSEVNQVTNELVDLWRNSTPQNSIFIDENIGVAKNAIYSTAEALRSKDKMVKDMAKQLLTGYVKNYGGALRVLLDKNLPQQMKRAKFEAFMLELLEDKMDELCKIQRFSQWQMRLNGNK